jgi:hypothetical protein
VGTLVEDSADLSVIVTILPESAPQEHQLRRQAVLIAQSSGKSSLFIGWVMVGPSIEVEGGMCGFAVYSMA